MERDLVRIEGSKESFTKSKTFDIFILASPYSVLVQCFIDGIRLGKHRGERGNTPQLCFSILYLEIGVAERQEDVRVHYQHVGVSHHHQVFGGHLQGEGREKHGKGREG